MEVDCSTSRDGALKDCNVPVTISESDGAMIETKDGPECIEDVMCFRVSLYTTTNPSLKTIIRRNNIAGRPRKIGLESGPLKLP